MAAAFGTVPSAAFAGVCAARRRKASRPSLIMCGDDALAKEVASTLAQLEYEDDGGRELAYRVARRR